MNNNELNIEVGVKLDDSTVMLQLQKIQDKIKNNTKLNFTLGLDKSVDTLVKELQNKINDIEERINKFNTKNKIEILNSFDMDVQVKGTLNNLEQIEKALKEVGMHSKNNQIKISVSDIDKQTQLIRSFIVQVKELNGITKEFKFNKGLIPDTKGNLNLAGYVGELTKITDTMDKVSTKLKEFKAKYNEILEGFRSLNVLSNSEINRVQEALNDLSSGASKLNFDNIRNQVKQLETAISKIKQKQGLGVNLGTGTGLNLNSSIEEIEKYIQSLHNSQVSLKGFSTSLTENGSKIKTVNYNTNEGNGYIGKYKLSIDSATNSVFQLEKGFTAVNRKATGFLTTLKESLGSITDITKWGIGATILYETLEKISNAIKYIEEMDNAMTDLNKVVDLSKAQMESMKQSALELGEELGKSSLDIMKAMAEAGRQFKNTDDIKEFVRVSTMASNVTDMTAQESAKSLTTVMKVFKQTISDAKGDLDSFNEIQNNFRVSGEDLAHSIEKVGEAAAQTGTSIHELNGVSTVFIENGLSGDEAGNDIRAILSRTYGLGRDGADGVGMKGLKKYAQVDVRDASGEFKSFLKILEETHEAWLKMDKGSQMALAQAEGGREHYSQFMTIMEQYNTIVKATNTSMNSQGSAMKENQKYLESTEGKLNQLKVAGEKAASNMLNSNSLKEIIDGITILVKTFVNLKTVVMVAVTAFALVKGEAISAGIAELSLAMITGKVKNAFELLNVTIIKNPIGLMAVALTTLIGVMDIVEQKSNNLVDSNKELQDSVANNIQNNDSNIQSLKNIKDEYEELSKKTSLSTDEQKRWNEICSQIAGINKEAVLSYDKHGKAVLTMKGNIDDLTESLKKKNIEEAKKLQGNIGDAYKEFQEKTDKMNLSTPMAEKSNLEKEIKTLTKERNKYTQDSNKWNDYDKQIQNSTNNLNSINRELLKSQNAVNESFQKLKVDIVSIYQDGGKYTDIFNKMDNSTKAFIQSTDLLKNFFKANGNVEEEMRKYQNFVEKLTSTDTYKKAQDGINQLSENQKIIVNTIMSGFNVSDFYKDNNMDEYYKVMAKIEDMARQGVPTLLEFKNAILTAFPDLSGKFSSDEWERLFDSIKKGATDASTSVKDLGQQIEQLESDLDKNLTKAESYGKMLSDIQKTGQLSNADEKMILTKTDYKDLRPYLKDMTGMAEELQKKLSNIKEESSTAYAVINVKDQQESLQELIDTYDEFTSISNLSVQDKNALNKAVDGLAEKVQGLNIVTDANGKKTITNIGVAKDRIKTLTAEQTYLSLVCTTGQQQAEQEMRNEQAKTKTLIEETEKRIKAQEAEYKIEKIKVNEELKNANTAKEIAEAKKHAESANQIFNAIVQAEIELDGLKEKQDQQVDVNKVIEQGNKDLANSGEELGKVIDNLINETNELTKAKEAEAQAIKEAKDAMKDYENQIKSLDNLLQAQENHSDTLAKGSQEHRDALKEEIELIKQEQGVLKDGSITANSYANNLAKRVGASDGSIIGQQIVAEAGKYLGDPYVWGGESPSEGFDCSGLVQYVYKQLNMEIARTTYDQINEGVAVSKDNLQPGDLVFFGTPDNPHHVGIYAGAGNYIQAPKTGDVVKISSLSDRNDYLTARRIVPSSNTSSIVADTTSTNIITADKLNQMLAGALAGHGQDYINAGKKYGVDPALAVAIATLETGHGSVVTHNNPAGIMDWDNNWKTLRNFSTLAEGIDYAVKNLKTEYLDKGLTTISSIGLKYAPVGASNDPNGTNKNWIPTVTGFYQQLTGKTNIDILSVSDNIKSAIDDMESKALSFQNKAITNEKLIREKIKSIFDDNILEFNNKTKDLDSKIKQLQIQNDVEKANSFVSISNLQKVRDLNKDKLDVLKKEKAFLDQEAKNSIYDKEMLQEISNKSEEIITNIIEGMKEIKEGITAWIQKSMENIEEKYKDTFDMIDNELTRLGNQETVDLGSKLLLEVQKAEAAKQKISEISEKIKELNDYMKQTGDTTQLDQLKSMTSNLETMNTTLTELNKNIRDSKTSISELTSTMLDKIKQVIEKTNEVAKEELNNNLKLFENAIDKEIKKLDEAKSKMDNNETNYDNIQNIVKLQKQLNALQGDDIETIAKKADLQQQLDEANRKLRQDNNNQEIDARKNALEKAKDDYNKAIETYGDTLDKSNTDASLNQQASTSLISGYIFDVNDNKIDLQTALTNFENNFGQGLTVLGNKIKTELLDNLKEVQNLLNEFGTLDITKMNLNQIAKNVYATGIDLENAKTILGAKGYNYIDTNLVDTSKISTKAGDISVGNSLPILGDAISITGSDRYATADLLQIYKNILGGQITPTGQMVYASGKNLENAKEYLGAFGYDFEDNGQTSTVTIGDDILSSSSIDDMKKQLSNYAQQTLQKYVEQNLKTNRIGNVYASGADMTNAKKYLEQFGYNFINTNDISNITLTSKDVVVGGSGVMKGASKSLNIGANWLWGSDRSVTEIAVKRFAEELKNRPFDNLPQYEDGGDIDYTGLAMVHGSKNEPETILNYKQGSNLHKFLTNIPQLVKNASYGVRTTTMTDVFANSDVIKQLKDSTQVHLNNSTGDEYNFEFKVDKLQATEEEVSNFAKRIMSKVKKRGY